MSGLSSPLPLSFPPPLIDAVKNRQAVLFAGAGISAAALGVTGITVRDAIGSEIQRQFSDYDFRVRTFEDVCDDYAALYDQITLVNKLASLIPTNVLPLKSHLAAVKAFRFIVTTNWDVLFERAYQTLSQGFQVLSRESDAPNFNYDQHNLLKIHGSADAPLTLVATSDSYENYPDTHKQLLDRTVDLLWNNTMLFVGYGLRDEHVRRLLARIRRERGDWARKAYAVGFYDQVRTRTLLKKNIEVLPYDAEVFLPALVKQALGGAAVAGV
jgi:hypothetical protein